MKNYNPTYKAWMVMVNGRYMVKATFTEEKSACGAEHFFLDEIRYGISAAQAFSKDEMKTDFFTDMFWACEYKTIEEIKEMSAEAKAQHEARIAKVQDEIESLKAQLRDLEYKLNGAKNHSEADI